MLEAIRNHFPDVVIVDEIMTRQEAEAARTITRRGVRLIATAHGETLADIVHNPELCPLVGGAAAVSSLPATRRPEPPIMQRAIAIRRDHTMAIYHGVAQAVDAILAGEPLEPDAFVPIPAGQE
jgi:stage III sporulation protein SpoIIIAA